MKKLRWLLFIVLGVFVVQLMACADSSTKGNMEDHQQEQTITVHNEGANSYTNVYFPVDYQTDEKVRTAQDTAGTSTLSPRSTLGYQAPITQAEDGASLIADVANTIEQWMDNRKSNSENLGETEPPKSPVPVPVPTPTPTPKPTPEPNPDPPDDSDYPTLQGTRILWKPVAEGDGNLVVLLPSNYSSDTKVGTISPLVKLGKFVGRTNGNRPTYRFDRPGKDFPRNTLLQVGDKTYLIEDPSRRDEGGGAVAVTAPTPKPAPATGCTPLSGFKYCDVLKYHGPIQIAPEGQQGNSKYYYFKYQLPEGQFACQTYGTSFIIEYPDGVKKRITPGGTKCNSDWGRKGYWYRPGDTNLDNKYDPEKHKKVFSMEVYWGKDGQWKSTSTADCVATKVIVHSNKERK